jgi:glutamate dehydrogenase
MYFELESISTIANHIMSLYGAKIQAFTQSSEALSIDLQRESENGALYVHTSRPGVSQLGGPMYEKRLRKLLCF